MTCDGEDRALLAQLSLEEKVSLLSGKEFWSLPAIPAIGLDAIVTSDGPTGVKCAGETPIPGVSARLLIESAREQGAQHVRAAHDPDAAVAEVAAVARPGDTVVTLGAGDVWKLGDDVLRALEPAAAAGLRRGR